MQTLSSTQLNLVTGGTEPDGDPGDGYNPGEPDTVVETQIGESRWQYDLFGHAGNYIGTEYSDFQLGTDPADFFENTPVDFEMDKH